MVYFIKTNTMGQMKQLLDNIFELELNESQYPDDLQMDFELWLLQKERQECLLSEEKVLNLQKNKLQNHE
jgi:hypothetical protein